MSAGIFPAYHKKLFDSQPAERSAGLTDAELIALGTDLKPQGDFAGCVNGATNAGRGHRGDGEGHLHPGAADRRAVRHPDGGDRRARRST